MLSMVRVVILWLRLRHRRSLQAPVLGKKPTLPPSVRPAGRLRSRPAGGICRYLARRIIRCLTLTRSISSLPFFPRRPQLSIVRMVSIWLGAWWRRSSKMPVLVKKWTLAPFVGSSVRPPVRPSPGPFVTRSVRRSVRPPVRARGQLVGQPLWVESNPVTSASATRSNLGRGQAMAMLVPEPQFKRADTTLCAAWHNSSGCWRLHLKTVCTFYFSWSPHLPLPSPLPAEWGSFAAVYFPRFLS